MLCCGVFSRVLACVISWIWFRSHCSARDQSCVGTFAIVLRHESVSAFFAIGAGKGCGTFTVRLALFARSSTVARHTDTILALDPVRGAGCAVGATVTNITATSTVDKFTAITAQLPSIFTIAVLRQPER